MAIHDHVSRTPRQLVKILTVDPANRRIEGMGKDMAIRQIAIPTTGVLFRWPVEGEIWSIRYDNGVPVLDSIAQTVDAESLTIETLDPGDALIASKVVVDSEGRQFVTVEGEPIHGKFLMWDADLEAWVPGTPGGGSEDGDKTHVHIQNTAAATWTINHPLNKFPSVTIVDSAGDHVGGAIINYINEAQLTATFGAAFAGKAYLN